MNQQMTVHVTWKELHLGISGVYESGRPGKNYLSNGDPGYPSESADFVIDKIWAEQGKESVDLTELLINTPLSNSTALGLLDISQELSELALEEVRKELDDRK